MALGYWQAKIWGILHAPIFAGLSSEDATKAETIWQRLAAMKGWPDNDSEISTSRLIQHIKLARYIAAASDRAAIGLIEDLVKGTDEEQELHHLLSAEGLNLNITKLQELNILGEIPEKLRQGTTEADAKQLFWWLWRCLPEATVKLGGENLLLTPAQRAIPDASIWSYLSLTAAMAGALAGYDLENISNPEIEEDKLSRACLVSFTFSPVQELIKASRKIKDLWAGSWILHYLSAKVCWQLAQKYGPDCFIYPSLFQQPLIDKWLLTTYPDFKDFIQQPKAQTLLTAGFPNVIVLVLPKDKVEAAMQMARNSLLEEWRTIADQVFQELKKRRWMRNLSENSRTWESWLKAQWQTYHIAVPIGREKEPLVENNSAQTWIDTQNDLYNLNEQQKSDYKKPLFRDSERTFLSATKAQANVGSWWNHAFDQTRYALAAVKNARDWTIPTSFGPRSTISGIGPVVHPDVKQDYDWIKEKQSKAYWQKNVGLFDGIEELNATETVKRALSEILENLLGVKEEEILSSYPDLTAGVAGYLKTHLSKPEHQTNFENACQAIIDNFPWAEDVIEKMRGKWGIPWADRGEQIYHPRLLNAGWLVEDAETEQLTQLQNEIDADPDSDSIDELQQEIREIKNEFRREVNKVLTHYYGDNNPADWYVLAAGDGDGMSDWLKGKKLKKYKDYIPTNVKNEINTSETDINRAFLQFIEADKRMGPSTHNGLSRALLDFSNQLVPYLTEERYAGKLIYGGGDDVLAYTNLWEWDRWLWDIRQCFRGQPDDSCNEFDNKGDYWRWKGETPPVHLSKRPLFTMGREATISFGIVIAHHSVPLAIALEALWESEKEAKDHFNKTKDAVQVHILYGNGNFLKATSKFDVFHQWQELINIKVDDQKIEASIFEQVANVWEQHPAPTKEAIEPWVNAFCSRREGLKEEIEEKFKTALIDFLTQLWETTPPKPKDLNEAVQNWFKVAAFMVRKRSIKLTTGVTV